LIQRAAYFLRSDFHAFLLPLRCLHRAPGCPCASDPEITDNQLNKIAYLSRGDAKSQNAEAMDGNQGYLPRPEFADEPLRNGSAILLLTFIC
jgi:hypothetical protein